MVVAGKDLPVMDWPTRLAIALGSAKGLAYLHEDCKFLLFFGAIDRSVVLPVC